jgi:hypothetical protein
MHPFLSDQLATARLAEIHADATRRRTIRNVSPGRGWRFWRRPRPGPPPGVVVEILGRDHVDVPETTLRPVA